MTPKEQEFLSRLRDTFRVEAREYVQTMAAELLALEKVPAGTGDPGRIETIFRTAHSLKGAARSVSAKEIELVCQALETVFALWKNGLSTPEVKSFDTLQRAVELVGSMVEHPGDKSSGVPTSEIDRMVGALQAIAAATPGLPVAGAAALPLNVGRIPVRAAIPENTPPAPSGPPRATADRPVEPGASDTVRIAATKLARLLREVEELLSLKQAAMQRAEELGQIRSSFTEWERHWSKFERSSREVRLLAPDGSVAGDGAPAESRDSAHFLEWSSSHLKSLDSLMAAAHRSARWGVHTSAKFVDSVIEQTKSLIMMPVGTITDSLPLMARQLGRDRGREIDLALRGREVEMDKRILDEIKDPLIHLLRNAVDHGVESPQERARRGKPAVATLTIAVTIIDSGRVEISVADDGAGIDPVRVKDAAVKKGVVSIEEAAELSDQEALALIFRSEVTTSPIVTDLSGRGLGLAIVREKTEKLGGKVVVDTIRGKGTVFRLMLPIALVAFRGLLVRVAGRGFVIPVTAVDRVALIKLAEVRTVQNREIISIGGRAISFVRLGAVLEIPGDGGRNPALATVPVVIVGSLDERVAFAVDEVVNDEEVLVKQLPLPLLRIRNVAGATLLASGSLVPVLNAADLLKSARKVGIGAPAGPREIVPGQADTRAKSVLVAEDSITSRTLIKGILESAGYRVKTAVDGVEALLLLRSEQFDLVVSDVQMPRMNGFDLTARIRAERQLAEIPVVLVTALSAAEDRERGIDVGASAYLVKSDFDQSNLLEIVRRLA